MIYLLEDKSRCPITILWKYHCKLPKKQKNAALYLHPKTAVKPGDSWYCDSAVGINKLQGVVHEMCKEASFEGKYTNHSLWSTSAMHMYDAGIDEQTICQFTGHRSNAVWAYKRPTESVKRKAMATLSQSQCAKKHCKTAVWMNSLHCQKCHSKLHFKNTQFGYGKVRVLSCSTSVSVHRDNTQKNPIKQRAALFNFGKTCDVQLFALISNRNSWAVKSGITLFHSVTRCPSCAKCQKDKSIKKLLGSGWRGNNLQKIIRYRSILTAGVSP